MDEPTRSRLNPGVKLALEMGPLLVFFVVNAYGDRFGIAPESRIYVATATFVVATILSLSVHFALVRRLPIMPLVSGAVVVVFGGLTIALQDELFIKLKPTVVNLLFGTALLAGLYWRKPLLAIVLDAMFDLDERGWRILTLRWAFFFYLLAALNEIVWRTQTTETWISFKLFGVVPLTIAFALAQTPLLLRHEAKRDPARTGLG